MASVVQSGEGATVHTSTQQWQSFEMRMRQRRMERLLLRAQVAQEAGSVDEVDEALAEAEQLSPSEPRIAELRARFSAAASASVVAPTAVESAHSIEPPSIAEHPYDSDFLDVEAPRPTAAPLIDLPLLQPAAFDPSTFSQPEVATSSGRRRALMVAAALFLLLLLTPVIWIVVRGLPFTRTTQVADAREASSDSPPAETSSANASQAPTQQSEAPVKIAVDEVPAAVTATAPTLTSTESVAQAKLSQPIRTPTTPVEGAATPARDLPSLPIPAPLKPPSSSMVQRTPDAPVTSEPPPAAPPNVPPLRESAPVALPNEPVAPPLPPPPEPPASPAVAPDDARVRTILARYESAYSQLDADAAAAVWPGVDRRALGRAFDGLAAQRVTLGACDVRIAGETAIADCAGSATWTPKVGGGNHTQDRRWQFRLRNASGDWQIVAAKVR